LACLHKIPQSKLHTPAACVNNASCSPDVLPKCPGILGMMCEPSVDQDQEDQVVSLESTQYCAIT
jgi:hypothetical protein